MGRSFLPLNLLRWFVFGILALGIIYIETLISERHEAQSRAELQNLLIDARNRIENNLISDIQLSKGLIAAVATNPKISQAEFTQAAKTLFQQNTQLINVTAAPDLVIRNLYPLEGNESALGLDLRGIPSQFKAVEQARKTRKMVLNGPVELVQGGSAFIARMPVFLESDDPEGGEQFWGVVSALIDEQKLYKNSQLLTHDQPIEIAIRGRDGAGIKGGVFYGRESLFEENPVTTTIQLPSGSWYLAAVATQPLLSQNQIHGFIRLGYGLFLLIVLAGFALLNRTIRTLDQTQSSLSDSLLKLNEREQLLQTVLDEIPDILVLKDRHGKFLLGNAAVARLYNTTPEALVGKDDLDFGVPENIADAFRQSVLDVIACGKTETVYEEGVDAKTGKVRHFRSIKKPFKDAEGNHQILIIAHDITEIVEVQEQLSESEARLRTILDNVDACIYLKDRSGKYLFANKATRQLWGLGMEEIVGFGDDKFFAAEDVPAIIQNDRIVLDGGERIHVEESAALPNGERSIYQVTKLPIKGDDDTIYALCGISVDITERIKTEQALRESEQRFKMAGRAAYDLIYEWDVKTDSLLWFGDVDKILGYDVGEVSHNIQAWLALIHPEDVGQLSNAVERHRCETDPIKYEYRIKHRDGYYLSWSDHALPLLDDTGQPFKWIGVCTDITLQKQQQRELEFSAYHDKLTSLPNRVLLADRLSQAMSQAKRREQKVAVVYIDLDGFKEVNDQYGHNVGDKLLIEVSQRFKSMLREGDTIARLGGDEFVVVMLDIDESISAIPLLQRILIAVSQPVKVGEYVVQVSASLGVSVYPQVEEIGEDQLLRQADQAMYQAKLQGKNCYAFFDMDQERTIRDQRDEQARVVQALDKDEFELYYQPKVNMRTGSVVGMEALIRWQHPEKGLLVPGQFLPKWEEHPISIHIGEWVIRTALQQMQLWQKVGLDLPVSINIGGLQLQQDDFVPRLSEMLNLHSDVPARKLELEVLESSALQDISRVSKVMKQCSELGVSFSLDDFGTGYSSLTYLKNLPASTLKIDQSFVRGMLEAPEDLAILEGVMGLSHAFRRDVIAEGVEELEQGILLLQLGCDCAQGYLIAKPMPAKSVPGWLEQWVPPAAWLEEVKVGREGIPLLFAEIEHRVWIKKIDTYLAGEASDWPEIETDQCRFGIWLTHEGMSQFAHLPTYTHLDELHSKVHLYGEKACQAYLEGDEDEATACQASLHHYSELLLSKLNSLRGYIPERSLEVID
ncbi:EAL domain-containing protein [uncultured Neptuniibacter sp.]|uniref:EAL domain-containing protein n=1 Tax=uncultured Neptuniibacter sp. TaxID=502143 RepID=UPI002620C450|nr:EAL domain-containing protein [uncultured Neptuniibacter sp.]